MQATIPITGVSESTVERVFSRINKDGPLPDQENPFYSGMGKCWEWMGGTNKQGYGRQAVGYKMMLAHRVVYTLLKGAIPHGAIACHRCDNPLCVNPDHVFLSDRKENAADRVAKGRGSVVRNCGERNGAFTKPEKILRGEAVGTSKFTESQVLDIRRRLAVGDTNQTIIAREYGVTAPAISAIFLRKIWKHI